MYIIAIGWLYVTTLMAITETSVVAGVLTFLFYGLFPVGLLLWLFGTPARRQRRAAMEAAAESEATATPTPATPAESVPGSAPGAIPESVFMTDQLADQPDRGNTERNQ